jgi:penicillin-binding protein 1C
MEKLGYDPATLLPDVELHLPVEGNADYAPRDYDGRLRGPVRLREALGSSLNVPAVHTLHELGVGALLDRLHELGFASLTGDAAYYGPGLALGDGEVTLLELVRAYAALARSGVDLPLRAVTRVERADGAVTELEPGEERRVMPRALADLVVDILKDHDARAGAFGEQSVLDFPFDVAAKTGTSKGYRDNWTVGFTKAVTVGVWVGNFGGEPMTNVSGITGAGPLFHAIMEAAMSGRPRERLPVADDRDGLERVEVCALSGERAGPDCPHRVAEWLPAGRSARSQACTMHVRVRTGGDPAGRVFERYPPSLRAWAEAAGRPVAPPGTNGTNEGAGDPSAETVRIAYPLPGARFVIDPDRPRESQRLDVRIEAPAEAERATLVVDGETVATLTAPFRASWPLRGGDHELVAEVGGARSPPVHIRVRD